MDGGFTVLPPQFQVALAPRGPFADSLPASAGLDPHGNVLVSQYEAPHRMLQKYKQTFFAANQADTTWTVGLALTYTGFLLCNPATSKKNLSILKLGFVLNAAPGVTLTCIGLAQGWSAAAMPQTAALSVYDGQKAGVTTTGNGIALAGVTTIPVAPVYRWFIQGAFTVSTLPSCDQPVIPAEGLIEVVPGGYILIVSTAILVHGMAWCEWAEVDP